jgi:hypothetical protein
VYDSYVLFVKAKMKKEEVKLKKEINEKQEKQRIKQKNKDKIIEDDKEP